MNSFIDLDGDLSLPEIDDISMSHHADVSVNSRTRDKTSTTTNIQDQIRKIQACKIELRKTQTLLENKRALDNEIQSDGYMFDKMGQRLDPVIDNVNLNEDQQCFIKQLTSSGEDFVPISPALDALFDLASLEVYRYGYSIEYCTDQYFAYLDQTDPLASEDICSYITNLVDEERFIRFLKQIPKRELKPIVLDSLALNACTLKDDLKIISTFELLKSIICQVLYYQSWIYGSNFILKTLKGLTLLWLLVQVELQLFEGLDIGKLETYLPNLLLELDSSKLEYTELLHLCTDSKKFTERIPRERISLLVEQFLSLLEISLDRRINAYKLEELDFIFLFTSYLSMDATFRFEFNESNHLANVFASTMAGYSLKCNNSSLYNAKLSHLRSKISYILSQDLTSLSLGECSMLTAVDDDSNDVDMDRSSDTMNDLILSNNIYHRFASLLKLMGSGRTRIKRLIGSLASIAVANLIESSKCKYFEPITHEPFLDDLLRLVDQNCIEMYSKCSYTMFCLIELFGLILDDLIFDMHDNDDGTLKMKIQCVHTIKEIATNAKRHVRDTGSQGRSQVKVCLDCFIWRIDFYTEKLNKELRARSKDNSFML